MYASLLGSFAEDGRRRRNSLSSLPNDSEERPRSPFPIPSPVPLGHGRSQSSSSLHERDRGLSNGELAIRCKTFFILSIFLPVYGVCRTLESTASKVGLNRHCQGQENV